jgi:hypothetical protein
VIPNLVEEEKTDLENEFFHHFVEVENEKLPFSLKKSEKSKWSLEISRGFSHYHN